MTQPPPPEPDAEPTTTLSVLFVCTANICRSAFAQLLAQSLTADLVGNDAITYGSAGTRGWVDQPVDECMAAELNERGVATQPFRSRWLTMRMVDEAEVVLTAEAAHRSFILEERPSALGRVFSLGQFCEAIETAGENKTGRDLLAAVRRFRGASGPEHDIVDPYRRGPEAAKDAADQIERYLRRVVPALTGRSATSLPR